MKKLLLPLFLLFISGLSAQKIIKTEQVTDISTHVVGSNFEGIIFNESYDSWYPGLDTADVKNAHLYTPTIEEIILTEKILYAKIKNIDKSHKYRNGLDIFKHWLKYRRQYIGYVDGNGDKIIFVNCFSIDEHWALEIANDFLHRRDVPRWYDRLIAAFDGGDAYWDVQINLKNRKLFDFHVNGSAV